MLSSFGRIGSTAARMGLRANRFMSTTAETATTATFDLTGSFEVRAVPMALASSSSF
jgi:hypothetical protein